MRRRNGAIRYHILDFRSRNFSTITSDLLCASPRLTVGMLHNQSLSSREISASAVPEDWCFSEPV
ncbi:hypothetical protein C7212DRAFT_321634, partial [Tuber magnatum]